MLIYCKQPKKAGFKEDKGCLFSNPQDNGTPILSLIPKGELDEAAKTGQQIKEGMHTCKKGENKEISSMLPER